MSFLNHHPARVGRLLAFSALIIASAAVNSFGQSASFWQDVNSGVVQAYGPRYSTPDNFRTLQLNVVDLRNYLLQSPMEFTEMARSKSVVLTLPMPDGSFADFEIFESPVMASGLAAKYPKIKTYAGTGITDSRAHIRLDVTQFGFHAMILSPRGDVFIDPVSNESDEFYIAYNKKDLPRQYAFDCEVKADESNGLNGKNEHPVQYRSSGDELRKYRLALACTGEYAATKGATISGALAGMVTSVNRVTGIYESELAIRMELIENDTVLIFLNAATDGYTNSDGGAMLSQNQNKIDNLIGEENYDIGHVFSTGGGGIAGLGVVCNDNQKANGVTGLPNPTGDAFDVDYVAHEMGHQFGANHTFNSTTGSCGGGNRWAGTAFEPGSASTIMGYAGICSPNDLQPHSDPFFHTGSYDEIVDYTTGSDGSVCPVVISTGNTPPVADAGSNYTIPFKTPFKLTGTGSDADGDSLSYMWEEIDKGPACNMNTPTGNAPSFRSFKADTVPYRYFPKLSSIINGTVSNGEVLSTYARSLKFRFIVRDNREDGGGVTYDDVPATLTVINTTTPFQVTYPNSAEDWAIGTSYNVMWDVSSTDVAPISCPNVNILLSVDGGYTYPVTLKTSTPNDGLEEVTIPLDVALLTSKARIMVQSAGNVFFDISNVNFKIGANTGVPGVSDLSNGITVFPNPTNGILNISIDGNSNQPLVIRTSDMLGRTIQVQNISTTNDQHEFTMDLSSEADGVYFVEVKSESGSMVKKIVKQ